jgi:hypothetical protein
VRGEAQETDHDASGSGTTTTRQRPDPDGVFATLVVAIVVATGCGRSLPVRGSDWSDADQDLTRLVPVSVWTADDARRLDSDPPCP